MFETIVDKLDPYVLEWYKTTCESNILSAITIGMNIVTSNNYQENEISIVNTLKEQIKTIDNDAKMKLKHQSDESNRREEDIYERHRTELKREKERTTEKKKETKKTQRQKERKKNKKKETKQQKQQKETKKE